MTYLEEETDKEEETRLGKELRELCEMEERGEDIHQHPSQCLRQKKSQACRIIYLDKENAAGRFAGSRNKEYDTTLDFCTCRDFALRRFPCKHLYRLLTELQMFGIPEEVRLAAKKDMDEKKESANLLRKSIQEIDSLTTRSRRKLYSLLGKWLYAHETSWIGQRKDPAQEELFIKGFLIEMDSPEGYLNTLPLKSIREFLKEHGLKGLRKKVDTVNFILEKHFDIAQKLVEKAKVDLILICFDQKYLPIRAPLYKHMKRLK